MIKTIIIDWHGVIDKKTFEKFVHLISEETNQDFLVSKNSIKKLAEKWTKGEIEPIIFWEELKKLFKLKMNQIEKLKKYILSIDLDKDVIVFLKENRGIYKIILLSDCPKDKAEVIKKSGVTNIFDHMRFSYDQKMSKENFIFFSDLLNELSLLPNECLYVDDNKKHISTALSLGLKTCLFKDINSLTLSISNQ